MEQTVGGTCAMIFLQKRHHTENLGYLCQERRFFCPDRYRLGHLAVYGCIHLGFRSVVRQDGLVIALLNPD